MKTMLTALDKKSGKKKEEQENQTQQENGKDFQADNPFTKPTQMKKANPFEKKGSDTIQQKSAIPEDVKSQMESSFGTDFSDVKIHTNSEKASQVGALAYTQGNDVHFAQGKFDTQSQAGKELLGHELTHVVQQREGRVQPNAKINDLPINNDKGLEKEADHMGAKAAASMGNKPFAQLKKVNNSAGQTSENAPAQMKIDNFEQYYAATKLGLLSRRGGETKGIDNLVKEYLRVRAAVANNYTDANVKTLTNLIDAIHRYANDYATNKANSTNKTSKQRAAKFRAYLGNITSEKTEITNSKNTYVNTRQQQGQNAPAEPAPVLSTVATFEAKVSEQITKDTTDQATLNTSSKNQVTNAEDATQQVEVEEESMDASDKAGAFLKTFETVMGGDNRSGLADLGGYKGVNGQETKQLETNEKGELSAASDMVGGAKSLFMFGYYLKNSVQNPSPDNIFKFLRAVAGGAEGVTKTVNHIAKFASGEEAKTYKESKPVGSGFEAAGGILDAIGSFINIFKRFAKTTPEQVEKSEIDAVREYNGFKKTTETLTDIADAAKGVFVTIKAIWEAVADKAPPEVLNAIPGLDVAISGINLVMKSVDFMDATISWYQMKKMQAKAKTDVKAKMTGGGTDAEKDAKIKAYNAETGDLRAKRANYEALYEEDGALLNSPATSQKDKEKIMLRRESTKDLITIVDEQLTGKKSQFKQDTGIETDTDEDFVTYELAKAFRENSADRLKMQGIAIATELTRLAGSIITLVGGPAAPIGIALKGVASGIDFAVMAGGAIVGYARDKSAHSKAVEMADKINAYKGTPSAGVKDGRLDDTGKNAMTAQVAGKRKDEFFSINENKSSAAKKAEQKRQYVMVFKQLQNYPSKLTTITQELNDKIQAQTNLGAVTPQNKTQHDTLSGEITLKKQAQSKIQVENENLRKILSATGINMGRLQAVPDNKKKAEILAKIMLEK